MWKRGLSPFPHEQKQLNENRKENFSYEDDLVVAPYDAHELECVGK
jgi:hypothetical protein